ncbi:MAG: PilZ domain-containing protein [Thiocapsa sp.]|jgi:hypothetical protein|nr:PilZ domain-containing protein [Thiocapsa sp.]MCG6896906.1 PilZ domain-containing protein [Thiocapsa sp.]MCG6985529.1 PilZ domain-containing protein [Thiocapsa sp.]
MATPSPDQSSQDRRSHRRLGTGIQIRVALPGSAESIAAENRDISWGGAQFLTSDPAILDAEQVTLTFPWGTSRSFSADAQVVRRETLEDGSIRVGVRFCGLSTQSHRRLEKLLHLLAKTDPEAQRVQETVEKAPLVKVLEVLFTEIDEVRHVLKQIRDGRLSVTVFGAYQTGQSIVFSIAGTKDFPNLRLRARVNAQEPVHVASSDWADLVSLDLRFEHSLDDLARYVGRRLLALPTGPRLADATA